MKILVMPDAHLKTELVDRIDQLLDEHPDWLCVSLGDWADDWGRPVREYKKFYERFTAFLKKHAERIECCWGNHDYAYYGNDFSCSGFSSSARPIVESFYRKLEEDFELFPARPRLLVEHDGTVFSHAGLSRGTLDQYLVHAHQYPYLSFYDWVEHRLRNIASLLTEQESPLWHRPSSNYQQNTFNPQILQVVGHTPVLTITHTKDDNVLYTDTWSTDANRQPLGDKSLVVIDTVLKKWSIIK